MPQAEREQIQDPIKRHECWKEFHSEQLNLKLWESGTNLIQNIHPISISGTPEHVSGSHRIFRTTQILNLCPLVIIWTED